MQVDDHLELPEIATLEAQIQLLTDVYNRIQSVRQIPPILIRLPQAGDELSVGQQVRAEFQQVKQLGDFIRSGPVQAALDRARESLLSDNTELVPSPLREYRKRRRAPSPVESPQPYNHIEKPILSRFPELHDGDLALKADKLLDYIGNFNNKHLLRLQVWERTRSASHTEKPKFLRFKIPDTLTAYLMLGYTADNCVIVESAVVFGPRERKAPHLQSDFAVYRHLSQQLGKTLNAERGLPFQVVTELLCSYTGLFIDRCKGCGRVLSAEGHIPPVVRVWSEGNRWEAWHGQCR